MAGSRHRSWRQLHAIYGSDEAGNVASMLLQGAGLAVPTLALVVRFGALLRLLCARFPFVPLQAWSLCAGFVGGLMGLMSVCFLVAAANLWYCSVVLRWRVARRMVAAVDWSGCRRAVDVGCGSGVLLNAAALRLKKEAGGGRVVGVDSWLDAAHGTMALTLKRAAEEGVQEHVTCKSGDPRNLPFFDNQFDVALSALCLHKLGREDHGPTSARAAEERSKALKEMLRILRPGGQAVIWDLVHVPEYVQSLCELNVRDLHVSEAIPAFMMQSHILFFKKP